MGFLHFLKKPSDASPSPGPPPTATSPIRTMYPIEGHPSGRAPMETFYGPGGEDSSDDEGSFLTESTSNYGAPAPSVSRYREIETLQNRSRREEKQAKLAKGPQVFHNNNNSRRPRPLRLESPPPPNCSSSSPRSASVERHAAFLKLTSPLSALPISPPTAADLHASVQPTRFVDILDAQSEIRPTNFRSRVSAAGARDYGEDVAERNMGENGLDLTSPHVVAFYARAGETVSERGGSGGRCGDEDKSEGVDEGEAGGGGSNGGNMKSTLRNVSSPPAKQTIALRRNRCLAGMALATTTTTTTPADVKYNIAPGPATAPTEHHHHHHHHHLRYPAARPHHHKDTGPRSSPAVSGQAGRSAVTPQREFAGIALPAIPDYSPPISPRLPRDSLLLAKGKQAVSPLSANHHPSVLPNPGITGVGASPKSAGNANANANAKRRPEASAPSLNKEHAKPSAIAGGVPNPLYLDETRRRDFDGIEPTTPSPLPILRTAAILHPPHVDDITFPPPYSHASDYNNLAKPPLHLEDLYTQMPSRHPAGTRHWSFSSTAPTTASTLSSNPFPPPQSPHTAGTSIGETALYSSSVEPDSPRNSFESLSGLGLESSLRRRRGHEAAAKEEAEGGGHQVPVAPSTGAILGEFDLDDYLSSDDDSLYAEDGRAVLTPRNRRSIRVKGEDADLLFRDNGFGRGGGPQLPGIFGTVPETGIATAVPLTSHPIPKPTRAPSLSRRRHHSRSIPSLTYAALRQKISLSDNEDSGEEGEDDGHDGRDGSNYASKFLRRVGSGDDPSDLLVRRGMPVVPPIRNSSYYRAPAANKEAAKVRVDERTAAKLGKDTGLSAGQPAESGEGIALDDECEFF